jgi:hypothetical protein
MAQLGSRGGTTWSMAEVQGMFKVPSSSRIDFVRYLRLFFCRQGTDLQILYAVHVATALSPEARSTINAVQEQ